MPPTRSRDANFSSQCELLSEWANTHPGELIPHDLEFRGKALGQWIAHLRRQNHAQRLSAERRARLDEICPTWNVSVNDQLFIDRVTAAKRWYERHGGAIMGYNERLADGLWIGRWLARQKDRWDTLPNWRRELLKTLPQWPFD